MGSSYKTVSISYDMKEVHRILKKHGYTVITGRMLMKKYLGITGRIMKDRGVRENVLSAKFAYPGTQPPSDLINTISLQIGKHVGDIVLNPDATTAERRDYRYFSVDHMNHWADCFYERAMEYQASYMFEKLLKQKVEEYTKDA